MNYKYTFTIFTPCYNAEYFIHRVIKSLEIQTFRDFEWFVIDDASTDNTYDLLVSYKLVSDFPIRIIKNETNQMLMSNFNLATSLANGRFFLPLNHDDEMVANALETFLEVWNTIPCTDTCYFSGVGCSCTNQFGNFIGTKYPNTPLISNDLEVEMKLNIKGEKWGFIRTDVMKEFPFPTEYKYVSENIIWWKIGLKYKKIYINDVLRIFYTNQSSHNSLTTSRKFKYLNGEIYTYKTRINEFFYIIDYKWLYKFKTYVKLARAIYHTGGKHLYHAKDIRSIIHKLIYLFVVLLSYPIIINDRRVLKKR